MLMIRCIVLLGFVVLIGCGQSGTEPGFYMPLPFAEKLENCANLGVEDELSATLIISGGFNLCPLGVDRDAGSVTGECPKITTGKERFLFIYYTVAPGGNASQELAIAYDLSYVDLTVSGLETGQVNKSVLIEGADRVTYYSDDDADTTNMSCLDTDPLIDQARCWASDAVFDGSTETLDSSLKTLDSDSDGSSNFDELCEGTLFDIE